MGAPLSKNAIDFIRFFPFFGNFLRLLYRIHLLFPLQTVDFLKRWKSAPPPKMAKMRTLTTS